MIGARGAPGAASSPGLRNSRALPACMVPGRPPHGTSTSASTRKCIVSRSAAPSPSSAVRSVPRFPSSLLSNAAIGAEASTKRRSSFPSKPSGSSAYPLPSATPTTRADGQSRCMIFSKLPATSPSGPPTSETRKASFRASIPTSRSARSTNTATPSLVTPNSLWLMPAPGFEDISASGRGWPRRAAFATMRVMSCGTTCSSGPKYGSVSLSRLTSNKASAKADTALRFRYSRNAPRPRPAHASSPWPVASTRTTALAPPSGMSLFLSCCACARSRHSS
mmetsp:Transcript_2565/g.7387  ORF Transcript_2565/g.7387 Transcript_2565/m.7387 type:complete len:279 (+) Transcript_2565:876-1712(+)